MTRSICLLIIFGNHEALSDDKHWKTLVDICFENKSITRNGNLLHSRVSI